VHGDVKSLGNSLTVFGVNLVELLDHLLLDVSSSATERPNNVLNKMSSICLIHHLSKESSWLLEIGVGMFMGIPSSVSTDCERCNLLGGILDWTIVAVGLVVDSATLISIDCHGAISLVVCNSSSVRAVNGDLVIVRAQSVSMGVWIRKDSALEHLIIRELNAWDDMGRRESALLNLSEVILWVPV
jgi:hypothetical protein